MFETKLTKREAQVLGVLLEGEASFSEIAARLNLKKPNLSTYLKKLEAFGAIKLSKNGTRKEAETSEQLKREFAFTKRDFPTMKASDVLAGNTPFLLAFAAERKRFTLRETRLPEATAKRLLARTRRTALFWMPKKGVYELRDEAAPLALFCRTLLTRAAEAQASKELKGLKYGVYSFDDALGFATVFVADEESRPKRFHETGPATYAGHSLQLILTSERLYSDEKPDLGDAVIHALAVSRDARSVLYAAAVLHASRYNPRKLLAKRHKFGLDEAFLKEFADFVAEKGVFRGIQFNEVEDVLK